MTINIEVIYNDDPNVTGVAIQTEDREDPIYVLPFPSDQFECVLPINENQVLMIGHSDDRLRQLLIAVFDIFEGSIIHRKIFDKSSQKYILSRDKSIVYGLGYNLLCLDTKKLELTHSSNHAAIYGEDGYLEHTESFFYSSDHGRVFHSNEHEKKYLSPECMRKLTKPTSHFFETSNYNLTLVCDESEYIDKICYWQQAVYELDLLNDRVLKRIPLIRGKETEKHKLGLKLLCASGKFGISFYTDYIPFSTGTDETTHKDFGFSLDDIGEHIDVQHDGIMRFGIALKFWDLTQDKPEPVTHIVRMSDASQWTRDMFNVDCSFHEFEQGLIYEAIRINNNLNSKTFFEKRPMFQFRNKEEKNVNAINSNFINRPVVDLLDDPQNDSYWVIFKDGYIRRVSYNGELGPLVKLEMPQAHYNLSIEFNDNGNVILQNSQVGEAKFHRDSEEYSYRGLYFSHPSMVNKHKEAFINYLKTRTATRIILSDFNQTSCAKAIHEQTIRLKRDYKNMLIGTRIFYSLKFFYNISGVERDEIEFFQLIIDTKIDIVSELRELLFTYINQVKGNGNWVQPWQTTEIPGLGSAMRALLILDSESIDLFRQYLEIRDGEHESYCSNEILPDYVQTHGWRNKDALRFGIYASLNAFWGNVSDGNPNKCSLLEAAAELVTAEEFTDMLISEATTFSLDPLWNNQDQDWYILNFLSYLDTADQYNKKIIDTLIERKPYLHEEIAKLK